MELIMILYFLNYLHRMVILNKYEINWWDLNELNNFFNLKYPENRELVDEALRLAPAYLKRLINKNKVENRMIKTCAIVLIQFLLASSVCWSENSLERRDLIRLESNNTKVVMDLGGGSIVDFSFIDQELNPFTWNYPEKGDLKPRNMGHFICFDRLGRPSPQEIKNGMPFHGEAAHIEWQML